MEFTIKDLKELFGMQQKQPESILKEGQNVFVRTVTYHYTGKIKTINLPAKEISLVDAAWIADSGRFANAMKTGDFSEVEPYPDNFELVINTQAIIEKGIIDFPLPRGQK